MIKLNLAPQKNQAQKNNLLLIVKEALWERRKSWQPAFSFFPNIFLKAFFTRSINPFPNKPWFLHVCCTSLLKTQWEKEKMLVTSIFSFSHSVSYSKRYIIILETFNLSSANAFNLVMSKILSFGKGLNNASFSQGLPYPLSDNKFLALLKPFVDDKLSITQKIFFVS